MRVSLHRRQRAGRALCWLSSQIGAGAYEWEDMYGCKRKEAEHAHEGDCMHKKGCQRDHTALRTRERGMLTSAKMAACTVDMHMGGHGRKEAAREYKWGHMWPRVRGGGTRARAGYTLRRTNKVRRGVARVGPFGRALSLVWGTMDLVVGSRKCRIEGTPCGARSWTRGR